MAKGRDQEVSRKIWKVYGITMGSAVLFALIIRFSVIEAYRIPTTTMRPTLEPGDTIFVGKWPFGIRLPFFGTQIGKGRAPERGEIVLFSEPKEPKRQYLKRVLGLPGDTVQVKGGQVSLNGKALPTSILTKDSCGIETDPEGRSHGACWDNPPLPDFGPERVAEGSVFVIGDTRSDLGMADKGWGIVPLQAIRGKALWIWLSIEPTRLPSAFTEQKWFPRLRTERMFRRIE